MTTKMHDKPDVEVFSNERQQSLIGLAAEDFHVLYDDYKWLLVRLSDQVVVAGCRSDDRTALTERFQAEAALDSLAGYAFERGPLVLAQATDGLTHAQRESERSDPSSRSR